MELLELYKEENRDILYSMSWLNKNSIFDKSVGGFQNIDLFTFLENINQYDYTKDTFYDDIYYILEYTEDTILHIIKNINREIKRKHRVMPISQAKEFDRESILWLSKKNGRTIKEKLSSGKIKAVERYSNIDTYENRIFKILLKKLVLIYDERDDLTKFDTLFIKIRKWLKSDESKSIDEYKKIVYNNILLHHKHYSKIFKSYRWFNDLNSRVKYLLTLKNKLILPIIKFETLSQIQFKSQEYILPSNLKIDRENFEIEWQDRWIKQDINLDNAIQRIKIKSLDEVAFSNIKKLSNKSKKNLNFSFDIDKSFFINENISSQIYIDLFRLFPVAKFNKKIVKFPITLNQKIDNKIVNANNTKIINLDEDLYTLPEILKSYDLEILKYFLEDFDKYFGNKKLNYIIPDYVNVFEFSQVKRLIGSYFKNSKSIPKSILAGFSYIERREVKKDDTLLYLQRNHDDELFVTPLLIKSNSQLKDITSGLYIERHPTRKIEESNQELVTSLSKIFSKKIAEELISKFLRNGIKGIKNEKIVFYQDKKIIDLNKLQLPNSKYTNILNLKKIYSGKKSLFKAGHRFIGDETNENLENFEKISHYEEQGFTLWREHLPDLSMEIVKNGYFDKFVLVDENSRIENKIIEIKEKFLIPADVRKLSFPLYLDSQNIGFKAEVTSEQFPFKNNVECTLELTYDYERETPYELTFMPLDKELKDIKVKWIKEDYRNIELPVPSYPPKKSWDELLKDPKRDGSGYSNLPEWIIERLDVLKDIDNIPTFILDREIRKIKQQKKDFGYFKWGKYDKNGKYFCFVEFNGDDVFCHSSKFKENIDPLKLYEGMHIYLNIKEREGRLYGENISFSNISEDKLIEGIKKEYLNKPIEHKLQFIMKSLKSIKYPLLTIWNARSLMESDVPNLFKEQIYTYIQFALIYLKRDDISIDFKKELLNFLSAMHQDMPTEISSALVRFSLSKENIRRNEVNFSLALGNVQSKWQIEIFNNILSVLRGKEHIDVILKIFSIASWRSKEFVFLFNDNDMKMIEAYLLENMVCNFELYKNNKNFRDFISLIHNLEFLLSLLGRRKKFIGFLNPSDEITKKYIKIIDEITKFLIEKKLHIKTRIKLQLNKPEIFKNTPNLLYALRVYLSGDSGSANSIKILGVSDD